VAKGDGKEGWGNKMDVDSGSKTQEGPARKKNLSREEQAAWTVLEASGEPWVQPMKAMFDADPSTFIGGLRTKLPDLHQRMVAAMNDKAAEPFVQAPRAQDNKGGKPGAGVQTGLAPTQLVLTTCHALGCVGQAVAGTDLVAEFMAQVQEASSIVGQSIPLDLGQHAPYPPNLLALAAVSACTAPGISQEARVTTCSPPQTVSDRNACVFLALALCRWQASGRMHDNTYDQVTKVLREMIAEQEALLRRRPCRRAEDQAYEDKVFPRLFAGDVRPFYRVGSEGSSL
jgi:hypothetical protein